MSEMQITFTPAQLAAGLVGLAALVVAISQLINTGVKIWKRWKLPDDEQNAAIVALKKRDSELDARIDRVESDADGKVKNIMSMLDSDKCRLDEQDRCNKIILKAMLVILNPTGDDHQREAVQKEITEYLIQR